MKRIAITVTCLATLALTACGGSDSSKKPITKNDQSNVKPFGGGGDGSTNQPRMVEGPDVQNKKP